MLHQFFILGNMAVKQRQKGILIEQILGADNRLPAWLAFVSAIVCLLIFGPSNFILPSLVITVALLSILRHRIEPVKAVKEEKEEA